MIRVLVSGAAGKMGATVVSAITEASGMEVVVVVDPGAVGSSVTVGDRTLPFSADLAAAIQESNADVMVDFTRPDVVESNLRIALPAGIDCVVGTTGLSEATLAELATLAPAGTCLFFAPNFAIGAVLMMRFAQEAARYLPHAEVVELHHDHKLDAPSGTAMRTAHLIAQARTEVPRAPGRESEIAGMEGARGAFVEDVPVHSVRMPGFVASQEVVFGGQGQTLTIRHDSIDRSSFMPGVVLACRKVGDLEGLVIGLEQLMEA